MAVGAGSIKRAAKASGKVEYAVQQQETLNEVVQEEQVVEKKIATKSTSSGKKASAKKAESATKKVSVKVEKEMVAVADVELDKTLSKIEADIENSNTEINQVCHITEELPIYLL